jgi:hypothetical protein
VRGLGAASIRQRRNDRIRIRARRGCRLRRHATIDREGLARARAGAGDRIGSSRVSPGLRAGDVLIEPVGDLRSAVRHLALGGIARARIAAVETDRIRRCRTAGGGQRGGAVKRAGEHAGRAEIRCRLRRGPSSSGGHPKTVTQTDIGSHSKISLVRMLLAYEPNLAAVERISSRC